jgi:hypothetical protein
MPGFADIAIAASFPLRLGDSKSLVRPRCTKPVFSVVPKCVDEPN